MGWPWLSHFRYQAAQNVDWLERLIVNPADQAALDAVSEMVKNDAGPLAQLVPGTGQKRAGQLEEAAPIWKPLQIISQSQAAAGAGPEL